MAQSYKGELGCPGCGGHMKAIEKSFEKGFIYSVFSDNECIRTRD